MVCSNCGNTLKENEKFCTLCGTYNDPSSSLEAESKTKTPKKKKVVKPKEDSFEEIGTIDEESFEEEEQSSNPHQKKADNLIVQEYSPKEDPDVEAYIGEDYKWIAERPFNIYALLLSWIYFLYRKLYLIGIIGLVITGIIYKYFQIILIPYIVLSMVGCGLAFNKIYLDIVEDRVAKLQKRSRGVEDMAALCKRKGGVTVIVPLFVFTIFLVVMLSSYIDFSFLTPKKEPNYWEESSSNLANCKTICRQYYNRNQSEEKIEEFGCEVIFNTKGDKMYNLYIKSTKSGKERYVFYEYDTGGYVTQKGDTELIEELEEHKDQLSESDKEFLSDSKTIENELSYVKTTSETEDNMIKRYENTSAKTHFFFTKDDLFK